METYVLFLLILSVGVVLFFSLLKFVVYLAFLGANKDWDIDYDRPPKDNNLH